MVTCRHVTRRRWPRVNLSAPFIRRPIGTILLTIGLALAGIAGFLHLPIAPLPQVDFPVISVSASLAGASPEVMAQSVATPLERRLATIAGVNEMTSSSSLGSTRVILQFDLSKNIDTAAREVQAAISASRADLPATLKQNPTYRKVNPAGQPVVTLALTSNTKTAGQIYDAVSNIVQQHMLQIQGVGDVEVGGGSLPAVRVDIDPYRLNSYGIAMEDVRAAIEAANANRPKGLLQSPTTGRAWQIYTNAAGRVANDYRPLVIAWRNGGAVRLGDIATVSDSVADLRTLGLYNGKRAIIVNITQQPDANLIKMVDAINAELPALRAQIPADIDMQVAVDRTSSIRASIKEIEITVVIALALVVLVVFAFLRDVRATMIPAVATIVSLLGTFGVMYLIGFSLNNLSLMAITVATGFVVDDAIVVLENTTRHLEQGMDRFEAALLGAREVGFTVLSMSLGLVAVFIPLLFLGGIVGRLFREFSVTLCAAVMISLVLSLTTTPMLCAWFLRPGISSEPAPQGRVARLLERGYDRVERLYARSLDWALAMRPLVLVMLLAAVCLTVYLYIAVPKGFFPQQESPLIMAGVRADESVSFQSMQGKLNQVVGIIHKDHAVQSVVGFTGGSRAGGAFIMIALKPVGQRPGQPSSVVIQRLQRRLQPVKGIRLFLSPVQDLRSGGRQGNATYQYTLMADSTAALKQWSQKLTKAMAASPVVTNVDSDLAENGVESFVTIDKDAASRIGITPTAVDNALYDAFGQRNVATIYEDINQYSVILGWTPKASIGPQDLPDIRVPVGSTTPAAAATSSLGHRRRRDRERADDQRGDFDRYRVERLHRQQRDQHREHRPNRVQCDDFGPHQSGATQRLDRLGAQQYRADDGAAAGGRQHRPGADCRERQSPGHRGRRDDLVRPGTRQSAEPGGAGVRRRRGADRDAQHRPRRLCRHRASVRAEPGIAAAADPGRAGDDLYRAGDALREPAPPTDGAVDAASGGSGGGAGVDDLRAGFFDHRADRRFSAARHRQEERHPHHRLRAPCRA